MMNVTDQRMMDQMQQMAANMMAALPQAGQNSDAPKTEKGDSFKDMMDKVKDQKAEAPKKDSAPQEEKKTETVQKAEQPQTTKVPVKTNGRELELTAEEAAMVIAGHVQLYQPAEDSSVMLVEVRDENGEPILPLAAPEENDSYVYQAEVFENTDGEWVIEPSDKVTAALKQPLQENDDPRSVRDILDGPERELEAPEIETRMDMTARTDGTDRTDRTVRTEVAVKTPELEQTDDQEDSGELDASMVTAGQPLFKDVKAAPVKVGENFRLDTEEPDMDIQLADTIRYAAEEGLRQIEIRLSPENLGNLTIKLTQGVDGALQVIVHTTTVKAADLLTRHADGLNAALQGYSQNSQVRVEVQRNEDSQQARQQFQQADPDGRNQQRQQQQRRQEETGHSEDFVQRLRLGLFGLEDI